MQVARYSDIKAIVGCGDLIETRTNRVIGPIIRAFTGQEVNHSTMAVILALPGSDYQRRYIIEADGGAVKLKPLSLYIREHAGDLFWSPVRPIYSDSRNLLSQASLELEGTKYDWKSLFFCAAGPVTLDKKKLLCSEMVQVAAIWAGLILSTFNSGKILRPGELHKTGIWEKPTIII